MGWGTGSKTEDHPGRRTWTFPCSFSFLPTDALERQSPGTKRLGGPTVWGSSPPLTAYCAATELTAPSAFWEQCCCTPRRPSVPMHPVNAPFSREEAGVSAAGIRRRHQEVSLGPGKPTPVAVPQSTRGLISSPGSLPLSSRRAGRRDQYTLASVSTTCGPSSRRSEINIKRRFCVFSQSNTPIHTRPAPWCPPGLGRGCFWPCPQEVTATWPGPPAGAAACRWGARPPRREARAAAESSLGRTCG